MNDESVTTCSPPSSSKQRRVRLTRPAQQAVGIVLDDDDAVLARPARARAGAARATSWRRSGSGSSGSRTGTPAASRSSSAASASVSMPSPSTGTPTTSAPARCRIRMLRSYVGASTSTRGVEARAQQHAGHEREGLERAVGADDALGRHAVARADPAAQAGMPARASTRARPRAPAPSPSRARARMSSTGSMSALGTPRVNGIASAMPGSLEVCRRPGVALALSRRRPAPRPSNAAAPGAAAHADRAASSTSQADHARAHVLRADRDRERIARLGVVARADGERVAARRQAADADRRDARARIPVGAAGAIARASPAARARTRGSADRRPSPRR